VYLLNLFVQWNVFVVFLSQQQGIEAVGVGEKAVHEKLGILVGIGRPKKQEVGGRGNQGKWTGSGRFESDKVEKRTEISWKVIFPHRYGG